MSGAGLWAFLVTCVGLGIIVALIFLAIEMIEAPDPRFKKVARFVVGGAALLVFLMAVGGVLGLGGGLAISINPSNVIEFGIGLLILLVVLYIVYRVIDWFAFWVTEIKYIVGAVAVIVILILAKQALFGGGLGFIPGSGPANRRSDAQPPANSMEKPRPG
jgi:hypothetical protein